MRETAPFLQQTSRACLLLIEREALASVAAALLAMAADLEGNAETA